MTRAHRTAPTAVGWLARGRAWMRSRPLGWRLAVPAVCACAGLLATTSMINARGTDLRAGRHTSLIGLVSEQKSDVEDLQSTVSTIEDQVDQLSGQVSGSAIDRLNRQIERLGTDGGLESLNGTGLAISLDDAPLDQEGVDDLDPNVLVVHQQDLQAVVNALWSGGAEAMSLQDQRIVSTTGIKCVGNTVLLQGVPYSPPYRITALGDPTAMYAALTASPEVQSYLDYTQPPYNLGWSIRQPASVTVPSYSGPLQLDFARATTAPGEPDVGD